MNGKSGSGCGCCGCGCGCLVFLVAIFLVLGMVFAIFAPINHNFEHMTPDYFDEYYPDTNDGTAIPADKGSILPAYELSESFAVVSVDF